MNLGICGNWREEKHTTWMIPSHAHLSRVTIWHSLEFLSELRPPSPAERGKGNRAKAASNSATFSPYHHSPDSRTPLSAVRSSSPQIGQRGHPTAHALAPPLIAR